MENNNFNLGNLPPYYIGQKLICINEDGWINEDGLPCEGPSKNETVTFMGMRDGGIVLKEYPEEWWPGEFIPAQESKLKIISYSKILEEELVSAN